MFELTKITHEKGSEIIRFGFGRHDFKWFIRVDLWWVAYRIKRKVI